MIDEAGIFFNAIATSRICNLVSKPSTEGKTYRIQKFNYIIYPFTYVVTYDHNLSRVYLRLIVIRRIDGLKRWEDHNGFSNSLNLRYFVNCPSIWIISTQVNELKIPYKQKNFHSSLNFHPRKASLTILTYILTAMYVTK